MQPFRRCIFAHHQTGVDDFLFGSIVTDSACFLILHHISIKICRCGYDRFSFTAPDNLYCKVKYRHDTIPPFCRIRHWFPTASSSGLAEVKLSERPLRKSAPCGMSRSGWKPRRRNEPGKRKRRPVATCGKLIRTTSGCP